MNAQKWIMMTDIANTHFTVIGLSNW